MIDISRLGRKKTVKHTQGRAGERREKKFREMAFTGRKRRGVNLHFHPARLTAVSGHR
jgi:hypothetical protein